MCGAVLTCAGAERKFIAPECEDALCGAFVCGAALTWGAGAGRAFTAGPGCGAELLRGARLDCCTDAVRAAGPRAAELA